MNKIYTINQINYEIENKKIVHNLNCEIDIEREISQKGSYKWNKLS